MTTDQTPSKEELEAEITELRQSVGETVDALSRRLDVKARVKERARSVPTAVPVGIAAAVVAGIGFWLWRRRG
jgi:hypothetical protein